MIFQGCHRVSVLMGTKEEIFEPGNQTVFSREFHFYLLWEKVARREHSDVPLCDCILSLRNSPSLKAMAFVAKAASEYKTKAMIKNNKQAKMVQMPRGPARNSKDDKKILVHKSKCSKFGVNYRK